MGSDPRTVLARYPALYQPTSELEPLGNAGGLSGALLWRFRARERRYVLRKWPIDGPEKQALERIHRWLFQVGRLPFIPVPVTTVVGTTLVDQGGNCWELEPWMEGEAEPTVPQETARVRAAFLGLAAFHLVLGTNVVEGVSPGIANRLVEVESWQSGGFSRLEECLANSEEPINSLAAQWLAAARRVVPRVRERLREARKQTVVAQPCLRDARPEHFLFQNNELTGLVDFGAMGVDTVAIDLARLLSEWHLDSQTMRDAAIQAYSAVRPLSTTEHGLISVFEETSSLLIGGRWAIWHYFEGREFRDPEAVRKGLEKGVEKASKLRN